MLPKLKYHEKKRQRQTVAFGGLNLTDKPSEGELEDSAGLTSERFPFLSPRYGDRLVHTFDAPHSLFAAGGVLYIGDGTRLYSFDGNTVTLITAAVSEQPKKFAFIGDTLYIFPDKVYYKPATGEFGRMELTASFTGFTITTNSITRTDGESFGFSVNDGVQIAGSGLSAENRRTAVITAVDGATLYFNYDTFTPETGVGAVTVSRSVPALEFVCEHENRLWGVAGNRIYASWLGMPMNFNAYDSAHAQASFYMDVGSAGGFTGCVSCPSYIAFFKEERVHRLYGSKPSNYKLQTSYIPGAESGSGASAVIANDTVLYNAHDGLYAYTGGEPEYLSYKTGRLGSNGTAACCGGIYYIAATSGGTRRLYSYDLRRGVWLCDGARAVTALASLNGAVWYIGSAGGLYELGGAETVGSWSVRLAPICDDAMPKRYSRVFLKLWLAQGASVRVTADNGGGARSMYIRRAEEDMRYELPLPVHAGSALRISLSGEGKCLIKGLVREYIE